MATQAPERGPVGIQPCQFARELITRDPAVTDPRFAHLAPDTTAGYETTDEDDARRFDAG